MKKYLVLADFDCEVGCMKEGDNFFAEESDMVVKLMKSGKIQEYEKPVAKVEKEEKKGKK